MCNSHLFIKHQAVPFRSEVFVKVTFNYSQMFSTEDKVSLYQGSSFSSCFVMSSEPIAVMERRNHFSVGTEGDTLGVLHWCRGVGLLRGAEQWVRGTGHWTGSQGGPAVVQLSRSPLCPGRSLSWMVMPQAPPRVFPVVEAQFHHAALLIFPELPLTQLCSEAGLASLSGGRRHTFIVEKSLL